MAITFTATAEPSATPPRIRLDLDTEDTDLVFSSITIRRDGQVVRAVAPVGSSVSVAYDYDAPYDVACNYTVDAVVLAPSLDWTETWPSLAAWTGSDWSVSGGQAISSTNGATIERSAGSTLGRVAFADAMSVDLVIRTLAGSDVVTVSVRDLASGTGTTITTELGTVYSFGSGAFDLVFDGTNVLFSGPGYESESVGYTGDPRTVRLYRAPLTGGMPSTFVDDVAAYVATGPTNESASDSATLAGAAAWLIHPTTPSLSVLIDPGPNTDGLPIHATVTTAQKATVPASGRTILEIEGSDLPVAVSTGKRRKPDETLELWCEDFTARDLVLAALQQNDPMLIRSPQSWNVDFPEGWFSVGDFPRERDGDGPLLTRETTLTLPLTPIRTPVIETSFGTTWGDLLTSGMTWGDLLASGKTWLDVLTG